MFDKIIRPQANYPDYPPFKNGLYLEEYFYKYVIDNNIEFINKKYLPIFWTNLICNKLYNNEEINIVEIKKYIDSFDSKLFTVTQADDGIFINNLNIKNFSAGGIIDSIHIPLVYEDKDELFFNNRNTSKKIFCSFNGSLTHNVRNKIYDKLKYNKNFIFHKDVWSINVNDLNKNNYFKNLVSSKFVLAPRGNGRTSFRLYEALEAGAIPIYIWDDYEFLPYKDEIEWDRLIVSININKIEDLESILLGITDTKIQEMQNYYLDLRDEYFKLDGICNYIIKNL
jgi:hypothetical protein